MQKLYSSPVQLSLALLTPLLLVAGLAQSQPADWEIDSEHFSIAFDLAMLAIRSNSAYSLRGREVSIMTLMLGSLLQGVSRFRQVVSSPISLLVTTICAAEIF